MDDGSIEAHAKRAAHNYEEGEDPGNLWEHIAAAMKRARDGHRKPVCECPASCPYARRPENE